MVVTGAVTESASRGRLSFRGSAARTRAFAMHPARDRGIYRPNRQACRRAEIPRTQSAQADFVFFQRRIHSLLEGGAPIFFDAAPLLEGASWIGG
jgi:hypothetical protein